MPSQPKPSVALRIIPTYPSIGSQTLSASINIRQVVTSYSGGFAAARHKTFLGLLGKSVSNLAKSHGAKCHKMFIWRFVNEVNNFGTAQTFQKSKLVAQAYNDKYHGLLIYAPTVQRSSQLFLLAITALDDTFTVFLWNVSQAYMQPDTSITRTVFLIPAASLNLPADTMLRAACLLCGLSESRLHCFATYHQNQTKRLKMMPSAHDPCLLFTPNIRSGDKKENAMVCLQTDDTIYAGAAAFKEREEHLLRRFLSRQENVFKRELS